MKKIVLLLALSLLTIFGLGQTAPTVTTDAITVFGQVKAQGGGNVTSDGGSAVTKRGLLWSTSANPIITANMTSYRLGSTSSGTGVFTNTYNNNNPIAPLLPNTTYYVRAYAINAIDTGYGNVVSFTTSPVTSNNKYYFSTSGNDANNGLTPSTPKKTLIALQGMMNGGVVTFLPGDTIFFKRGDMFANGYGEPSIFPYVSFSWINRPYDSYTAPSGIEGKPIVLTNYGDPSLPLPNFVYPNASSPSAGSSYQHNVMQFAGVKWIVIDGLQFNDTRFPYSDKAAPAYTRSSILMGEYIKTKVVGLDTIWGTNRDYGNRTASVFNFTLQNCYFSNTSFGLGSVSAFDSKITKCTFTNFKSTVDTFGINDVLAGAIEGFNGKNLEVSYNYIKGAWAKSCLLYTSPSPRDS